MTKIKITKEIKELDGEVIEKPVTPFGTSAHIPFGKKHTGKVVNVVVPTGAEYVWVLSAEDLKTVQNACNKVLREKYKESRVTFHLKNNVLNLGSPKFSFDDLIKTYSILKKDKRYHKITKKLKYLYAL